MVGLGKHDMLLLQGWMLGATEIDSNEGIKAISRISHALFYVNSGTGCQKPNRIDVELFAKRVGNFLLSCAMRYQHNNGCIDRAY